MLMAEESPAAFIRVRPAAFLFLLIRILILAGFLSYALPILCFISLFLN